MPVVGAAGRFGGQVKKDYKLRFFHTVHLPFAVAS